MTPTLYEKVMIGKRTTYREHIPAPITMPEIEQKQVTTLLTALTLSMLVRPAAQSRRHGPQDQEGRRVHQRPGETELRAA